MANSKKAAYFEAAENLFVQQGETRESIAVRYELSDKTVRTWAKDGKWEEKRAAYLARRSSTLEDLEYLVQSLLKSARADVEAQKEVPQARWYALANLTDMLQTMQKVEKVKELDEKDKKAATTKAGPGELVEKVNAILGL